MQVGVILEHVGDLERRYVVLSLVQKRALTQNSVPPSPVVVEAASSIIYAAPYVDSRGKLLSDLVPSR